jgi:hypothetical protein
VGENCRIFATEEELVEYTQRFGQKFPLEDAYAEPLLRYLLREIDNEYLGNRRNTTKDIVEGLRKTVLT